jgi:carbamoyl-phosphate synthase large subunit
MKPISVLLTAIGAPGAVNIIGALWSNGERQIKIVGLDIHSKPSGRPFVDAFNVAPKGSAKSYPDVMTQLCDVYRPDVLLPLSTEELLSLARNKKAIETTGTKVCIGSEKSIEIANDKKSLFEFLSKRGIPVPDFIPFDSPLGFQNACAILGQPFCIKPAFAHGSRGMRIISNLDDTTEMFLNSKPENASISFAEAFRLIRGVTNLPTMLAMEYLPGHEYSVDMLCQRGVARIVVVRLREEIRSGISFRSVVVENQEIEGIARRVCEALEFDGPMGIQLKEDKEGKPKVIEVNPRLHGSCVLSVAAGANIPYLSVKQCLGESFETPAIRIGTRLVRYWGASIYDSNGLPRAF